MEIKDGREQRENDLNPCWLCDTPAPRMREVTEPAYYHCPQCQLIFIQRQALPEAEEEKRLYGLHENTRENKGYVKMLTRFMEEAVLPYRQPPGRGLDFGCGPGPVLRELLQERGFEMHHYDPYFFPSEEQRRGHYALITATEVFEHLHHPYTELQRLRSWLSPGGILSIMTQFYPEHDFSTWHYRRDPTHVCFYAPETFRWIAKHLHFHLRKLDDVQFCVLQKCAHD